MSLTPEAMGGLIGDLFEEGTPAGIALMDAAVAASNHRAYSLIDSLATLRRFMSYHVWCVWDFMSLAKSVQVALGCYSLPWLPPDDAAAVAIINEIISSEESDLGPDGLRASHFQIYLRAMREAGADIGCIEAVIAKVGRGLPVNEAMAAGGAPTASCEFVNATMEFCCAPLPERIAAFALGREDLVPHMLMSFLSSNRSLFSETRLFEWYVRRHIELDMGSHAPLSSQLFRAVIRDNADLKARALAAGLEAIGARCRYLDRIAEDLERVRMSGVELRDSGTASAA